MSDLNIAITGFGGLDFPDSGPGVARAIRLARPDSISVSALGYDLMMTGAWMKGIVDELHLLPLPNAGDAIILERLLAIHQKSRIDALIPSLENDVPVFSRLAEPMADAGIRTLLPAPESIYAVTRAALPAFIFETGIPALDTKYVADLNDVPKFAEHLGFPLTVMGTVLGGATAYSATQAWQLAASFNATWGGGAVLQQHIDGDEFSVAVLADADGTDCDIVAIRKLAIDGSGHTECGCVVEDPQITELARNIVTRLNWRGPLEIEFVRPPDALEPLLRNIRCCFPQWIAQSHFADYNLPARLIDRIFSGSDSETGGATAGSMFVRGIKEAAVPLDNLLDLKAYGSASGVKLNGYRHNVAGDFVLDQLPTGLTVAVTGISTFDMINPGLGTALALHKHPQIDQIIGLNYGTFDSGSFQHEIFAAVFKLPTAPDKDALFERIKEIHAERPFEVLIPCLDGELPRFIALQESIESLGIKMLLPSQTAFERREKIELFGNQAEEDWFGFRIPHGILASSETEAIDAAGKIGLPVVVKGPMSGCYPAYTLEEVRSA